tara:strand:- start:8 stop:1030 length:1023 start_codon:yes stop_codon:yes gene_type:complete
MAISNWINDKKEIRNNELLRINKGLKQYEGLGAPNKDLGQQGFDIFTNTYGAEPAPYETSGAGVDGSVIQQAICLPRSYERGTSGVAYNEKFIEGPGEDGFGDELESVSRLSAQMNPGGASLTNIQITNSIYGVTDQSWIKINKEIMWVYAINLFTTPVEISVIRAQQGTLQDTHLAGSFIQPYGYCSNYQTNIDLRALTKTYKVPSGYWNAIKVLCNPSGPADVVYIQTDFFDDEPIYEAGLATYHDEQYVYNRALSPGGGSVMQSRIRQDALSAKAVSPFFNFENLHTGKEIAFDGTGSSDWIGLQAGEMIYGKFNRVALLEPVGTLAGINVLALYRG